MLRLGCRAYEDEFIYLPEVREKSNTGVSQNQKSALPRRDCDGKLQQRGFWGRKTASFVLPMTDARLMFVRIPRDRRGRRSREELSPKDDADGRSRTTRGPLGQFNTNWIQTLRNQMSTEAA